MENVKTYLQLIPLLVCVSIVINAVEDTAVHLVREHEIASVMLNQELTTWLFSVSYLHSKCDKVYRIWFVAGYIRLL